LIGATARERFSRYRLRSHGRCRFHRRSKHLDRDPCGTRACTVPGAGNVRETIRCLRTDSQESMSPMLPPGMADGAFLLRSSTTITAVAMRTPAGSPSNAVPKCLLYGISPLTPRSIFTRAWPRTSGPLRLFTSPASCKFDASPLQAPSASPPTQRLESPED
jgi:hypothetical protein